MAECKKKVGQGAIQYPCVIEVPEGRREHEGPCKAVEDQASVARRERWERGGEARATLAQTQSRPLSFADANQAHTPSPVPGSRLQPAEHRERHQPKVGEFGEKASEASNCAHPFDATIEDSITGEIYCRECGTLLRPGRVAQEAAQSTLGTFVSTNVTPPDFAPAVGPVIPPINEGDIILYVPDENKPNMAILARVTGPLDGSVEGFEANSLMDGSRLAVLGTTGIIQVYPSDANPDALMAELGWPRSAVVEDHPITKAEVEENIEPTKQREGDQQLPAEGNPRRPVQDIIIEAMQESKRVGIERYGQPLKPMNGRDTFQDAQEEARDFYVYLTALIEERKEMLERAERAYASITDPGNPFKFPEGLIEDVRLLVLWLRGTPQT